ncbi:MAG: glycoside hydrolase family 57 protein [Chryseolinea sp.]
MNSQYNPKTRYLNIYFQIHQPRRLGQFSFFDIGTGRDYFDDGANQIIMRRIAKECYQPTNLLLLKLIKKHPEVRFTFSISGVALNQMEQFAPAVIESFRMLAATGAVEFLSETYYHSLSCLISAEEFAAQVKMHRTKIHQLFDVWPVVFRNTELIYNDDIGRAVNNLGFDGILTDGFSPQSQHHNSHHVYEHTDGNGLRIFFRNYNLSDDIAFRYTQTLTPKKYLKGLDIIPEKENLVTLGLDYETFGEHQKRETGVFEFLEGLIEALAVNKKYTMITPSEAIHLFSPCNKISVKDSISWADQAHDLSAWLGNEMQCDTFDTVKNMEQEVKNMNSAVHLDVWRYLQTSDHLYYMSTKTGDDGNVHNYFSPYASPYEAFMNFMNVVSDFSLRVKTYDHLHIPSESKQRDKENKTFA